MIGYCQACDKLLNGKQRLWCSDACRTRYNRATANRPETTGNRPGINNSDRESTALDRESTGISYILVVRYDANGFGEINRSMDSWALKNKFQDHVTKTALQWLESNFDKWTFEIVSVEVKRK